MNDVKKLIDQQCTATANIREEYGLQSAISYLIGEKFINCLKASERSKEHAEQIEYFAMKIKEEFQPYEITAFFDDTKNFSNFILDEEGQREMDDMMIGADDEIEEYEDGMNVVGNAEAIMRIEYARELLA